MATGLTATYDYTAGTQAASDWTNISNAWDSTNNTYATRSVPKNTSFETAKWIKGTTNECPATISGLSGITKVEIGVEAKASATNNCQLRLVPVFGGSTDGDTHDTANLGTSDTTTWFDITSDTNAPGTWALSDIQNLDTRMYGKNSNLTSAQTISIDQIYVRITYDGSATLNDSVSDGLTLNDTPTNIVTALESVSDGVTFSGSVNNALLGFAVEWGEQSPSLEYDSSNGWSQWIKSTGDIPQTISGSDWGYLDTYNQTHLGPVYDTTITSGSYSFTLHTDQWQSGSGNGTVYIRGSMTTFSGTDETPSWEEITSTVTNKEWRYVQLKVVH